MTPEGRHPQGRDREGEGRGELAFRRGEGQREEQMRASRASVDEAWFLHPSWAQRY